jgi:hypothetical protein
VLHDPDLGTEGIKVPTADREQRRELRHWAPRWPA